MSGKAPFDECAACGSPVDKDEVRCVLCGSDLAPEASPTNPEADILDWPLCPTCGADNDPRGEACRTCGSLLEAPVQAPEVSGEKTESLELSLEAGLESLVEIFDEPSLREGSGDLRRLVRSALDDEILGSLVAAAAVGIYASALLRLPGLLWGLGALLATLVTLGLFAAYPEGFRPLRPADGILLAAGAALPALGLTILASLTGAPSGVAIGVALSPALLLGAATFRLIGTPARVLLALAGATAMLPYAFLAAGAPTVVGTPVWSLGLAVASAFPGLLVWEKVRKRRDSERVDGLLARAQGRFARRRYAASLRAFDRAIERSERDAVQGDLPWYGKGAALTILGRYDEALRAIDRALDLNPQNEVAWVNKGNALARVGRPVDALRAFNAAIKVNPNYEVAWNNKGNALARLGRPEEALRCYDRALAIDPGYRSAWVNKGHVLATLARYDEAGACAETVMRLPAKREVSKT